MRSTRSKLGGLRNPPQVYNAPHLYNTIQLALYYHGNRSNQSMVKRGGPLSLFIPSNRALSVMDVHNKRVK